LGTNRIRFPTLIVQATLRSSASWAANVIRSASRSSSASESRPCHGPRNMRTASPPTIASKTPATSWWSGTTRRRQLNWHANATKDQRGPSGPFSSGAACASCAHPAVSGAKRSQPTEKRALVRSKVTLLLAGWRQSLRGQRATSLPAHSDINRSRRKTSPRGRGMPRTCPASSG